MTLKQTLGEWNGVSIGLAAWDGAAADVDLSCACMFQRELGHDGLTGGLLHLDVALDHALTTARQAGHYRGDLLETLLLDRPAPAVKARAVLVVGLGDPQTWTPQASAAAAAAAVRVAMQRAVTDAAFAPSLLDAGLSGAATAGVAEAMMRSVLGAISAQVALAGTGQVSAPRLREWIFDVGPTHVDATAARFLQVLSAARQGS